jgi:hypothetical protein
MWAFVAAAVVLASGCAQHDWIDRTLVTENVTGAWTGSFGEGNSYRELRLDLRQEGTKVTGFATRGNALTPGPEVRGWAIDFPG